MKITDQQQVMSNLVQNYAEFGVEAIQRFRIEKVILTHDDQIIKVCEVSIIDDEAQFQSLPKDGERDSQVKGMKDKGLKLIEMYASLAKSESRILMNQAIKINQAQSQPVSMLFLIASIIRYQTKT